MSKKFMTKDRKTQKNRAERDREAIKDIVEKSNVRNERKLVISNMQYIFNRSRMSTILPMREPKQSVANTTAIGNGTAYITMVFNLSAVA